MYAQLCKRLGEHAPNFDPEGKPCTFKRLLLNKCRDEFENRAVISQQYENRLQSSVAPDCDIDSKFLAKRKMLGNIKFIGELGKLEMVHDSILHRCCEQLLVGRKKQPIPDQEEDLECLCHLLKTCGRILDTPKAKVRMDQYFERLTVMVVKEGVSKRIRFLIQDIVDLRKNHWIPKKLGKAPDGPRTIQQVREDAFRDGCIYLPQPTPRSIIESRTFGGGIPNPLEGMFFNKRNGAGGMDELFGGYSNYLGTGPGVIGNYDTNGYISHEDRNSEERGDPRASPAPNRRDKLDFGDRYSANRRPDRRNDNQYKNDTMRMNGSRGGQSYRNSNDNDVNDHHRLPSRFKKILHQGKDGGDVSLRPQHTSMLFKPKTPSLLPKSAMSRNDGNYLGDKSLLGGGGRVHMQPKESPMIIKQGSLDRGKKDKNRGVGGKGRPTREMASKEVESILKNLWSSQSTNEAVTAWKEFSEWLPNNMSQTAMNHLYTLMLDEEKNDAADRELAFAFVCQLVSDDSISIHQTHCQEGLNKMISLKDSSDPHLAGLAASSIDKGFVHLDDFDINGSSYPLLFQTLVRLQQMIGRDALKKKFSDSSVSLMKHIPEQQTEEKLASVLEEYELTFLVPILAVQQDMISRLQKDSDPNDFYKWVLDNVDEACCKRGDFIMALFGVILDHITSLTTLLPQSGGAPGVQPDRTITEQEKDLMLKFRCVLQPYVRDNAELQLLAVYALQVFCNSKGFPKGMLLRLFVNFYENDILDERAFLQWKEDVKHSYPGKGKALFQVNTWLTWLEEAESEEEDDEDNE